MTQCQTRSVCHSWFDSPQSMSSSLATPTAQQYGLIAVPTDDRCNCDNRCRDCCIFNCSALLSALVFICFALSFAAFAFAFIRSTRFSAAPLCLISSSVIQTPINSIYMIWGQQSSHQHRHANDIAATVLDFKQRPGSDGVCCIDVRPNNHLAVARG